MKKILITLCLFLVGLLLIAANTTQKNTNGKYLNNPIDVVSLELADASAQSKDTIATTATVTYGPYGLALNSNEPMYSGFHLYAVSVTGTTPTFEISYCITPSDNYVDTSSTGALAGGGWVSIDTVATSGYGMNKYVALSSVAGRYIWFRFNNYDSHEAQVPNRVYAEFKKSVTFNVK